MRLAVADASPTPSSGAPIAAVSSLPDPADTAVAVSVNTNTPALGFKRMVSLCEWLSKYLSLGKEPAPDWVR